MIMPRYEYQCNTCGQVIEANQRMTDPPLTDCECGEKGSLTRLLSAGTGLIFKGNGFYITDYKNGSNGNGAKEGSKSETKTETSTESKSESSSSSSSHSCGSGCGCN